MKSAIVFDRVYGIDEVDAVARELVGLLDEKTVMTFSGSLGAGKTTLIQAIARQLGVQGPVQSPTFAYVHSYRIPGGELHHFDLYRLSSAQEFIEAGFHEYLYQPSTRVFIEWPAIIEPLLTRGYCAVELEYVDREKRHIKVQCFE